MVRATKKMQVYELLKERIEGGCYPLGSRLPKEVDLAAELGVSRITLRPALELLEMEMLVSRVKGQGTFVRDEQTGRIRVLVIIVEDDLNSAIREASPFPYILPCIRVAAERVNMELEICRKESLLSLTPEDCAARLRSLKIEGIIWPANHFKGTEILLKIIRGTGVPVLLPHATSSDAEITGFTVLGTDFNELTRDGLQYLAMLGHRRVGYIGGPHMHRCSPADYFACVRSVGMDPDPELLRLVEWQRGKQVVFDTVAGLMKLPKPPTAIFSYSDYLSVQIYEYLHREKIRIPEDVSVLTTGGQIGCDFLDPPLSALEYDDRTIGETAVRILLEMIHDHRRFGFIVTPHRLKVRESTRNFSLFHSRPEKQEEQK